MPQTNRNLSTSMFGDDVLLLQKKLIQLGFTISGDEVANKKFGESTRQAVLEFQKKNNLNTTGEVEEKTAALINKQAQNHEENEEIFIVKGTVCNSDRRPLENLVVCAFDQDLPSLNRDELIGETITGKDGKYEIRYTVDKFKKN